MLEALYHFQSVTYNVTGFNIIGERNQKKSVHPLIDTPLTETGRTAVVLVPGE